MRIQITADDDTLERFVSAYEKIAEAAEEMPWRSDLAEAAEDLLIVSGRLGAQISGAEGSG